MGKQVFFFFFPSHSLDGWKLNHAHLGSIFKFYDDGLLRCVLDEGEMKLNKYNNILWSLHKSAFLNGPPHWQSINFPLQALEILTPKPERGTWTGTSTHCTVENWNLLGIYIAQITLLLLILHDEIREYLTRKHYVRRLASIGAEMNFSQTLAILRFRKFLAIHVCEVSKGKGLRRCTFHLSSVKLYMCIKVQCFSYWNILELSKLTTVCTNYILS